MTDIANVTINKKDEVEYKNKENQIDEAPKKESQSVAVTVTGFSLFATTLN